MPPIFDTPESPIDAPPPQFPDPKQHLPSGETSIVLPDLFVSFLSKLPRINPYYEVTKVDSERWIAERCGFSAKSIEKHKRADFSYYAAIAWPDAGPHEFRMICDWCNWIFDFDDLFDDGELRQDPERARQEVDDMIRTMDSPNPAEASPPASDLVEVFRTTWLRLAKKSPRRVQRRYIRTMTDYANGLIGQVDVESAEELPELDKYFAIRRGSIAVTPMLALLEYAMGLDMPNEVVDSPEMRRLERIAIDIIVLQNDVLSWNKEQAMGVTYNIISLFMKKGLSCQQAYDAAGERLRALHREWYLAMADLPLWGEEVDAQAQEYVRGCQLLILANVNWSFRTERYFGRDNLIVRQTRRFRILTPKNGT